MRQYSVTVNGSEMSRVQDEATAVEALKSIRAEVEDDGRLLGEIPADERHPGHVDGFVAASKYASPWNGGREVWAVVTWDDETPRRVVAQADASDAAAWLAEQSDERVDAIMAEIRVLEDVEDGDFESEDELVLEYHAQEIAEWRQTKEAAR